MRGPGLGGLEEVAEQAIGPYEARVRMRVGGLCNTTDRMVRQGEFPPDITFPSILGHESVGEVVELGGKVRHLEVGELVTRSSAYSLGQGHCAQNWGGLCEAGVVRDERAMLEDGLCTRLSWLAEQQSVVGRGEIPEHAALAISVSEVLSVTRDVTLTGARIVIVGTGVAGLSLTMHASRSGAQSVTCVGRRESRLDQAVKCGADHVLLSSNSGVNAAIASITAGGADVVFEASGDPTMVARAMAWSRPGGQVVVYGLSASSLSLKWADLPRDVGLTFPSTRETSTYHRVLKNIRDDVLKADLLVTHRFPFSEIDRAFETVDRGDAVKALIVFD